MMNNLITSKPSMTSLEIAELVEKRHDNVKRTIETLLLLGLSRFLKLRKSKFLGNDEMNLPPFLYSAAKKGGAIQSSSLPSFAQNLQHALLTAGKNSKKP